MSSRRRKLSQTLIVFGIVLSPLASRAADDDVKRGHRCMIIAALSFAHDLKRTPDDIASEALLHCEDALDNASYVMRERIMTRTKKYIDETTARNLLSGELLKQTTQYVIEARQQAAIEGESYYENTARNIAIASENE